MNTEVTYVKDGVLLKNVLVQEQLVSQVMLKSCSSITDKSPSYLVAGICNSNNEFLEFKLITPLIVEGVETEIQSVQHLVQLMQKRETGQIFTLKDGTKGMLTIEKDEDDSGNLRLSVSQL